MQETLIDTDYLVIGSGTAGLAFADTLIAESDAHVTIVGQHAQPDGMGQDKTLREWIRASRLDGFGKRMASADREDAGKQAIVARPKAQSGAAMANLPRLMAG